MRRAPATALAALALAALGLADRPAAAQTDVALHEIEWYVHDDLVADGDGTGSEPLSFYESLLAQAVADADLILKGASGPADTPCCAAIENVSVQIFSDVGANTLNVIDSDTELSALDQVDGTGMRGFLIQDLQFCGGPGNPVGCADTPGCGTSPSDLKLVVAMDAGDELPRTIAHERGHNTCLTHPAGADRCVLMNASAGGDCLRAADCSEYRAERTSTAGTCDCHPSVGSVDPDGTSCSEAAISGLCSGGVCGEVGSDASVRLFAAGGTAAAMGDTPDDPLLLSGITGGWSDPGEFADGRAPEGMAHAPERGLTFAVAPDGAGGDVLLTVEPETGAVATVGTVSPAVSNPPLVALAFDPGGTSGPDDDRLLALDLDGSAFSDLYEIDPDTAASTNLGSLGFGGGQGFQSLAYDPVNDRLYAGAFFAEGIFEIELPCCNVVAVDSTAALAREHPGLAYSAATESVYFLGGQNGPRTLFDAFDADALALGDVSGRSLTRAPDLFSVGGLAARPVPAPGAGATAAGALAALAALARRRGC